MDARDLRGDPYRALVGNTIKVPCFQDMGGVPLLTVRKGFKCNEGSRH